MFKVSLVSPNYMVGPVSQNSYYLPYGPGVLWNYAHHNSEIVQKNYELDQLVWRREDIEVLAQQLKDNSVVGFSTYIWNDKYNNALAKRLKELNPHCLIIFGGPQPPVNKKNIFQVYPYIDICVKTEGEYVFKQILEQYCTDKDYENIKGILINDRNRLTNNLVDTGESVRINDLCTLPSPYLSGLFDKIIADNPDVNWSMILETTRGCPYACTFCDWGGLTYSKVKKFDMERCLAEIEWCGQIGVDYLFIADANFGMFYDRDIVLAQKIIEVKKKYNKPSAMLLTWAKNQKEDVIKIAEVLNQGGMRQPLNVSVQSLNDKTLESIKRSNFEINKLSEIFQMCEERSLPMFTELILGLPDETLDTWKQNFYNLYEAGNHEGIGVYQCALLENAEMNLEQVDQYGLERVAVQDYILGSEHDKDLTYAETVDVVSATKDMSRSDMVEAQIFTWYQSTFHIKGLTNYIARFLRKSGHETYENFYQTFWEFLNKDEWFSAQVQEIKIIYNQWFDNGKRIHNNVGDVAINAMNLGMSMTIKLHHDDKFDHINDLIREFVNLNYGDLFEQDLIDELLDFQINNTIQYRNIDAGPIITNFNYDFLGHIIHNHDIKNKSKYKFGFGPYENFQSGRLNFLEHLWYSKRGNAGTAAITKIES